MKKFEMIGAVYIAAVGIYLIFMAYSSMKSGNFNKMIFDLFLALINIILLSTFMLISRRRS